METCAVCSKNFPINSVVRHRRIDHPGVKPYECQKCPFQTDSSVSIFQHKNRHETLRKFKCSYCSVSYDRINSLHSHIRSWHPNYAELLIHTKSRQERPLVAERTDDPEEKCTVCSENVPARLMTSHLVLMHRIRMMPFVCADCPYKTTCRQSFGVHRNHHLIKKEFKCLYCSVSYGYVASTNSHIRKWHPNCAELPIPPPKPKHPPGIETTVGDPEGTCPVCSKKMPLRLVTSHRILHHRQMKPLQCEDCPYETASKYLFDKHITHHIIQSEFKCMYCTVSYKNVTRLHDHIRECHQRASKVQAAEEIDKQINEQIDNRIKEEPDGMILGI